MEILHCMNYFFRVYLHAEAEQLKKVRSKFGLDTTKNEALPDGMHPKNHELFQVLEFTANPNISPILCQLWHIEQYKKYYLLMESYYFLVLQQLRRITASQVKEFLVLCREKYMRAKSEPGTKLP